MYIKKVKFNEYILYVNNLFDTKKKFRDLLNKRQ